jgi:hypothetical protein
MLRKRRDIRMSNDLEHRPLRVLVFPSYASTSQLHAIRHHVPVRSGPVFIQILL